MKRDLEDARTGQGMRGVATTEVRDYGYIVDVATGAARPAPPPEPDPGPRVRHDPMVFTETVELDSGFKRRVTHHVDYPLTHSSTVPAISPAGHLIDYPIDPFGGRRPDGSPILAPGFRVATEQDIAAFHALASELAAGQS